MTTAWSNDSDSDSESSSSEEEEEKANLAFMANIEESCSVSERRTLWDYMVDFSTTCTEPWLVGGDFNSFLALDEKKGGKRNYSRSTVDFQACVSAAGLEDAGYIGNKYTWFNGQQQNGIWIRIDRIFFNAEWTISCSTVHVQHLGRSCSDHSPLLISNKQEATKGPSRFTFQHMWCSHESFISDSAAAWRMAPASSSPLINMAMKLKHMKSFYGKWNKEVFGNISTNIQEAEASFSNAQNAYDEDPSNDNYNVYIQTKEKLEHVLSQEEQFWRQKSRIKWLKEGDNNTKFFHAYAVSQRRLSLISTLHKEDDTYVDRNEDIAAMFVQHFSEAFTSASYQINPEILEHIPTILHDSENAMLCFDHKAATNVTDGLLSFLSQQASSSTMGRLVRCTFMAAVWEIWCSRNRARYQNQNMSAKHIVNRTMLSIRAASASFKLQNLSQPWSTALRHTGGVHAHPKLSVPVVVKWMHPPTGRLKLNVDGAFRFVAGEAGGGGILCDHHGRCVFAFATKYQGVFSALDAETRALRDGLAICSNQGILNILVETDSLNLMQIVTEQVSRPWELTCIIQDVAVTAQKLKA
ncbi:hypothetical protein Taro_020652 [Colocasia esculenta]|uniref:RNase H type-1 domain-containing protein n=1 Tax=Colocasia esculenta TaxID=4460 RepID=A0A843V5V9_COLES|nr:hypothetical protein [Colocasia esculenta]